MKQILLCTDGSSYAQSSYRYGAWLATRLGATVEVLYVTDARGEATAAAANLSGSIGLGASDALLKQLVDLEHERAKINHQRAKLILKEAERELTSHGAGSVRLVHKAGFLVDYLEELETEADLIVLGQRGEAADFASGHLGANVERIVRASAKSCLVSPRQFRPIERLLLAYDGSESSRRMLDFVAHSPLFQGLELHLVTAVPHTASKAKLEAMAVANLEAAKALAQAAGFEPICSVAEGNPEAVIAQYSEANQIDLLVIGAYGHSRVRYLVIGSTTAQVLRRTAIPVLVFR